MTGDLNCNNEWFFYIILFLIDLYVYEALSLKPGEFIRSGKCIKEANLIKEFIIVSARIRVICVIRVLSEMLMDSDVYEIT
jgi:hypothetical protein